MISLAFFVVGQIIVDHGTVSPRFSRKMADTVAESGGSFLDAPISGGPQGARNGSCLCHALVCLYSVGSLCVSGGRCGFKEVHRWPSFWMDFGGMVEWDDFCVGGGIWGRCTVRSDVGGGVPLVDMCGCDNGLAQRVSGFASLLRVCCESSVDLIWCMRRIE